MKVSISKKKRNGILLSCGVLILIMLLLTSLLSGAIGSNVITGHPIFSSSKIAPLDSRVDSTTQISGTIIVNGNSGFYTLKNISGNGTENNPFVIQDLSLT
ncbi:MAG: hypothetical protein QXU18_05825, partial [Thermoplasmatales archaeon]